VVIRVSLGLDVVAQSERCRRTEGQRWQRRQQGQRQLDLLGFLGTIGLVQYWFER
jgi:hypothetical protein